MAGRASLDFFKYQFLNIPDGTPSSDALLLVVDDDAALAMRSAGFRQNDFISLTESKKAKPDSNEFPIQVGFSSIEPDGKNWRVSAVIRLDGCRPYYSLSLAREGATWRLITFAQTGQGCG